MGEQRAKASQGSHHISCLFLGNESFRMVTATLYNCLCFSLLKQYEQFAYLNQPTIGSLFMYMHIKLLVLDAL